MGRLMRVAGCATEASWPVRALVMMMDDGWLVWICWPSYNGMLKLECHRWHFFGCYRRDS